MKKAKEYYDEFSLRYDKPRERGYHLMIDQIEAKCLEDYLSSGIKILDIGCGTGLILERIKSKVKVKIGIDISRGMLFKAKARRLWVFQSDVLSLPFKDNSFDLVYSFKVLAHVEEIKRAIKEMTRIVRPGGYLVLEFYNRLSLRYLARLIKRPRYISDSLTEAEVYTRYDTPSQIKKEFLKNLEIIEVKGARIVTPFAAIFKIWGLSHFFLFLEKKLSETFFSEFAGFYIVIAKKKE
jgi:ubiquinone/menaquinone biosynthesis C-methylase UbiE